MAIKFQYNKTALNELDKKLKARTRALPTIKSKESALRLEVKKAKGDAERMDAELEAKMQAMDGFARLFTEFKPDLIRVEDVQLETYKIAGVRIPRLKEIVFKEKEYPLFNAPLWYADGLGVLKDLVRIGIESEIYTYKMNLLDDARKKTTQKVNLYEKVQIPGYNEAIRKIKRFLEDEDNLAKSAQKIVKRRHEQEAGL
ncbi:MAG: V-type ATP synthase subunit D [Bacteroidetes bacterium]|uniref:V-type ATP synthase subunit D n=1 Tax=Candidatus Pullibacteroides excrementavium TaxID=2840905 RepID=A0A9D9H2G8_9BACT|nr:V-type ATP synthase subunit D [Candidatus Pullibacteroides excrementavium]